MKDHIKSIVERRGFQEAAVMVFAFVLFTMNDWLLISNWKGVWKACCYFLILYSHAQLNRFFLLPILFKKHKPFLYALFSTLLILLFALILYKVATLWLYYNCFLYKSIIQHTYLYHVGLMLTMLICIMGPILMFQFYREQKKQSAILLLSNQMQLNSLKSQLNPHFLFNTLNTLYGISLAYPSRTPELIMQISQLMRYQLENGSKDFVSLEDELIFIKSYVDLETERVGHRCKVSYKTEVDNNLSYKIAPMMLITFLENAFKHGTGTIESCAVQVNVRMESDTLFFDVVNTIPVKKSAVESSRIGLKNVKERLKIIYPNKHLLQLKETSDTFSVHLELNLH